MRIYIIAAVAAMLVSTVSARVKGGAGDAEATKKKGKKNSCKDPVKAVLANIACFVAKDVDCSVAAAGPGAKELRDEIDLETVPDEEFWQTAFLYVDQKYETKQISTIGENQVSYRYIRTTITSDGAALGLPPSASYPFSETFIQHEHALVTVDDDCKVLVWDAYGGSQELMNQNEATSAMYMSCLSGSTPSVC